MSPVFEIIVAYLAAFGLVSLAFLVFEMLAGRPCHDVVVVPREQRGLIEELALYIEKNGLDGHVWVVCDEPDDELWHLRETVERGGGVCDVVGSAQWEKWLIPR